MNITHIQECADYFRDNYLKTFYLVVTYSGKSFILIRYVFAFDECSKLVKKKEYTYTHEQKEQLLHTCARNNSNLLVDKMNAHYYINIATQSKIHCRINHMQY